MKPSYHVIISGVAGVSLSYLLNSFSVGIYCFLTGVLMDLDHVIDFFIAKKKLPLSYHELDGYCKFDKGGRLYLIFHGLEYFLILSLFTLFYPSHFFIGIFVGFGLHLLCDQLVNPLKPLGYFIFYRINHNFERKNIFTQDYAQKVLYNF